MPISGDQESLKVVGFHFSRKPTVNLHVRETVSKVRRRFWILRHIKHHGLTEEELLAVYCSILRSVLEYACVVFGPMLSQENEEDLERVQSQSLKIIYGFNKSYGQILASTGVQTLKERRDIAIRKFAVKSLEGSYSHWFPLNERGRSRHSKKFREDFARCDRHKNSPIFAMRRVLNDMYTDK